MPNPANTGSREPFRNSGQHLFDLFLLPFSHKTFWQDIFRTIPPNMSLEPVLAGFGITGAVEKALGFPAAAALSKMTFTVGRISKCTLDLKLLVILFCSPEVCVGLSYRVKCADRSAPPPNLRVSENRVIVNFETRV